MPNLEPGRNQQNSNRNNDNEVSTTPIKFENHLLSIKDDRQEMIRPNCHPTYNERHEKIIEMIDWTLERYRANREKTQQHNEQEVIIDNIIEELAKKKRHSYTQKETSSTKR